MITYSLDPLVFGFASLDRTQLERGVVARYQVIRHEFPHPDLAVRFQVIADINRALPVGGEEFAHKVTPAQHRLRR